MAAAEGGRSALSQVLAPIISRQGAVGRVSDVTAGHARGSRLLSWSTCLMSDSDTVSAVYDDLVKQMFELCFHSAEGPVPEPLRTFARGLGP